MPKGQSEEDWEKRNAPMSKSLTNLPLLRKRSSGNNDSAAAGSKEESSIKPFLAGMSLNQLID